MKQAIAIAVIVLASLSFIAGTQTAPKASPDSQRSEPVIPVPKGSAGPVETPLVEAVLPKHIPDVGKKVPKDGQLSPRGEWRWSTAQWAWVPVKQPGPAWHQDGHSATVDHLVNTHGIDRKTAERMTPAQRDVAHSNAHNAATVRKSQTVRSSGCPGGVCPSPSVSRGLFGRRR